MIKMTTLMTMTVTVTTMMMMHLEQLEDALVARDVERREPILVRDRRVGARVEQQPHALGVLAFHRRRVQRRAPLGVSRAWWWFGARRGGRDGQSHARAGSRRGGDPEADIHVSVLSERRGVSRTNGTGDRDGVTRCHSVSLEVLL